MVTKDRWRKDVKPGCQLIMSVIISKLFAIHSSCPKCNRSSNCASNNFGSDPRSVPIDW
jgi:hypothetical protein